MAASYTYQTSSDFINKLEFDYIETYSFQRGAAFDADIHSYRSLADKAKLNALSTYEKTDLSILIEKGMVQHLVCEDGKLHPSREKTHCFNKTDAITEQIINLLKIEAIDVPMWMCTPFYRDAVIFYDNNGVIVAALNICFSCEYMALGNYFQRVDADQKTYRLFRQLFVELGHQIEDR